MGNKYYQRFERFEPLESNESVITPEYRQHRNQTAYRSVRRRVVVMEQAVAEIEALGAAAKRDTGRVGLTANHRRLARRIAQLALEDSYEMERIEWMETNYVEPTGGSKGLLALLFRLAASRTDSVEATSDTENCPENFLCDTDASACN
jgi:hypothetical protein